MASIISWYGGKARMANQIINIMPRHKTYVEVFGGGGHVLLNKPRAPLEVYNDLNKGLFCLFNTLRDEEASKELQKQLQLTSYSKNEFDFARNTWFNKYIDIEKEIEDLKEAFEKGVIEKDTFEKELKNLEIELYKAQIDVARMTYVLSTQSFSATLNSWSRDLRGKTGLSPAVKKYLNGIDKNLPIVVNRMRTVQVENLSFEHILEKYDSKDTFFYLDPPYIHETREEGSTNVYNHEMDNSMHKMLVKILLNLKGKFILSGYDHPIYDPLSEGKFKKVKLGSYAKTLAIPESGEVPRGEEYIWINYNIGE